MARIDRNQLKKLILKEFKMMGMAPMGGGMIGHSPYEDHGHEDFSEPVHADVLPVHKDAGHGSVSREDCCAAVMCLIECCSCPITKQALAQCCDDILGGLHDQDGC